MSVGSNIHALRLEKRFPQKIVAQYLNVSVSTVSNYEVDRHLPDIETLSKLADLYDVSVDFIIGRTKFRQSFKGSFEDLRKNDEDVVNGQALINKYLSLDEAQRAKVFKIIQDIT